MFNLHSVFENMSLSLDAQDEEVDRDFITDFLQPYFLNLPREELAARVMEVIRSEQNKRPARRYPRSGADART